MNRSKYDKKSFIQEYIVEIEASLFLVVSQTLSRIHKLVEELLNCFR